MNICVNICFKMRVFHETYILIIQSSISKVITNKAKKLTYDSNFLHQEYYDASSYRSELEIYKIVLNNQIGTSTQLYGY